MQNDTLTPGPLRLLHLEDKADEAQLVRLNLSDDFPGLHITHVPDRAGFLAAIKGGPFDLILLDYSLQGFDGMEALQTVRAEAPETPVIFLSGVFGEEIAVNAIKNGATDYIPKDQLPRLGPAIRRALREVQERHALRQADEQLRRSQRELAEIVASSADAIIGKDLNGVITSWNFGAEKIFGYRADEARGHSITMLLPPDRAEEEQRILELVRRGERVEPFETVRVRKDGSLIHIAATISPIRNAEGKVIGASKIARDITASKRAGELLRASENLYRLLFESNPTPTLLYEQESLAFLSVNEAAVRHYGFTRGEFAAMNLEHLALPGEIPLFVQKLSSLTAEAGNSGIWRHRKKDGKLAEMEITSHPVVLAEKKAWLSLAVDVTERLSLEAQLRQSQKMESVGQLAGGIA
ncbi:MAG TPA: PAS domain S-box protein, partial [Verrucomicrobiae bacterium]|nr:PAS domain S-box protein [Verrucomicrobiae bacterium]